MKALVLTSTSLRHRYFAMALSRTFDLVGVACEQKRNYYTQQQEQSAAIRAHFAEIARAEAECFESGVSQHGLEVRLVEDVNAPEVVAWAQRQGADVICLFGTSILGTSWLSAFPDRIVNLHLGLSPWYRGSATLFWPFADHALEFLGTTIHLAVAKVDAGAILHRIQPELRADEGYYGLTNRLIRESADVFPGMVQQYLAGHLQAQPQESVQGRLCRKADFNEAALERALMYASAGLTPLELERIIKARACLCLP